MRMRHYLHGGAALAALALLAGGCHGNPPPPTNVDMAGPPGSPDMTTPPPPSPDLSMPGPGPDGGGPPPGDMGTVGLPGKWAAENTNLMMGQLFSIAGTDATHIWAAGEQSTILFSKGDGTWKPQTSGVPTDLTLNFSTLFAFGGATPQVFATYNDFDGLSSGTAGSGEIYRTDDLMTWKVDKNIMAAMIGLWGTDATHLYAVGQTGAMALAVQQRTGTGTWKPFSTALTAPGLFHAIWGADATHVYAVGEDDSGAGVIYFSKGDGSWAKQTVPDGTGALLSVSGTSATDIHVGGQGGALFHSKGDGTWTQEDLGGTVDDISGVWAAGPGEAWAAGTSAVYHLSGGAWSAVDFGTTVDNAVSGDEFLAVWGSGAKNVYVLTSDTTTTSIILHYTAP